ncbi:MAG: DUF5723 family protein, partial [Bacteroidota bacterium]|nr:DUF5723 family protein [Bacteroidota bacterium]
GAFSNDFFNLSYFGNTAFQGSTANLSGFDFNLFQYQQIEGGIIFNQGRTGIGLSVLNGQQHQSFSIPKGNVYIAPDGKTMEVDLLFKAQQTDPQRSGYPYTNGVGASIDFFTTFNFGTLDTFQHKVLVEIRDLGFIRWNRHATEFSIDTNYRFEGFFIDNIFMLRDTVFDSNLSNNSLAAQANTSEKRYTTVLPAFFHIAEIYKINEDFSLMGGIKYRLMANYNVYYYIRGMYQISPLFEVSPRIAYGGYGKLNTGISLRALIKEYYTLTLGTENLEGFLLPAFTAGTSAFLTLHRRF